MKNYYLKSRHGHIIKTDSPDIWSDYEKLPAKSGKLAYQEQEKTTLKKWLKPGNTVYTLIRSVSASGMSRRISCYIVNNGEIQDISGYVGEILEWRRNDKDGSLIVGGCGMDMGFHTVYYLARALFRDEVENDAGYTLKQRWL